MPPRETSAERRRRRKEQHSVRVADAWVDAVDKAAAAYERFLAAYERFLVDDEITPMLDALESLSHATALFYSTLRRIS